MTVTQIISGNSEDWPLGSARESRVTGASKPRLSPGPATDSDAAPTHWPSRWPLGAADWRAFQVLYSYFQNRNIMATAGLVSGVDYVRLRALVSFLPSGWQIDMAEGRLAASTNNPEPAAAAG